MRLSKKRGMSGKCIKILLLLLIFTIPSFAESSDGIGATSGTCGNNATWSYADGTLTISGTGTMSNYTSDFGTPWEVIKPSITSVVVANGITSIGDYSFSGCSSLTSIDLPEGLRTIGINSFSACNSLVSIVLPSSVTTLGNNSFAFSRNLQSVNLPSELTAINYQAFRDCTSLSNIIIPENVRNIGSSAFYHTNISSIILPESVNQVGIYAFSNCANLASFTWSSSAPILCEGVLGDDDGEVANKIKKIILPEGVTTIETNAFSMSTTLSEIHLPLSLEKIGSGAFYNCPLLTDIYYAGSKEQAESILIGKNANLTSATWHYQEVLPPEPPQPTSILTLPSFLTTIESEAFAEVAAEKIIVPDSVDKIFSKAFANCPNLKILYFEGSPFSIANDILYGCKNVTIIVVKGSSAENWAKQLGLTIEYHN